MSVERLWVTTDDGVRLAYWVAGNGPHNLLLMHGWAGSANSWNAFVSALDLNRFRAIAFDVRGQGDSDKVEFGYTDERFARDALAIADAAGARTFTAVGFSMGGRFVQYLPLVSPKRVAAMVIIAGGPASGIVLPEPLIAEWVGWTGNRERFREGLTPFLTRKRDPGVLDEFVDDAVKASRHSLEATLRMCLGSFQEELKRASPTVPTLVVAGKMDALLGPEVQKAIAAQYSGEVIELDCGHEILVEMPTEAAQSVAEFIVRRADGAKLRPKSVSL